MFVYDPEDPDNWIPIKPLKPLFLKIVDVIDKDSKSSSSTINSSEEYTYVTNEKTTNLKWCFWIEGRENDFEKDHIIKIKDIEEKAEAESNFFLTSQAEDENEKKKENTELLQENAVLSAITTTETHDVDGKQKEVPVLKLKFSKWLEGENIHVEVYYDDRKPTRDSNKEVVKSLAVALWNIVYYDKQGNFLSGDITNNAAIVAISNENKEEKAKCIFLTTEVKNGGTYPNYSTTTHFITQGELLDRANWAFGEGNGAALLEYAFAIDNLQKKGKSKYSPFSSEKLLKLSWNDLKNYYPAIRKLSSYAVGEVNGEETNFWYARQNNQLGTFKSEFASGTDAISATIIAILRLQKDPVDGAFQWLGGKRDVSEYNKGVQRVVTSSFGDKSYHTFFQPTNGY